MKPGNIMLDENYYIKLIDFGEAKIIDPYDIETDSSHSRKSGKSMSSSGASSFFGRLKTKNNGDNNGTSIKKVKKTGTFVGTSAY